ncbi:glycosyltransferase [Pseudooceanicola sediminis]|uniref:Glycosyltransferase n=1 Tax=Pseudooceanicola sediminis TaxID=2211117 RepID=A0A399J3J3_9RHOB|nr:glycosyltransferase family 4 protein [Pseudooceanicola sediminis]KAA2314248.1 glycosyltransferase family 4 protein [Puniceibacterium sp. HSS470]RII39895.1 glycosyltransferase [Pseudooceanicola sediminis]
MLRIAHLVDDTSPGGVTRYLDFLTRDPAMQAFARHDVIAVPRNSPALRPITADIIVSHLTVTWRGLPGLMMLRARHAGTPLVHVEHSYSGGFVAARVTARARFQALLRCAYALFDRVVAVSEGQRFWLVSRNLIPAAKVDVIHPCVDLSAFRALPAIAGPARTFGLIGRFDAQKGFDIAIHAFRALPDADVRLNIYGSGAEEATLRDAAGNDPRIRFHPFVADPAAAMAQCDAIVMPSRWEPYGIVALEARAAGRLLAVSFVDGLRDHAETVSHPCRGQSVSDWTDTLANMAHHTRGMTVRSASDPSPERQTREGWLGLFENLTGKVLRRSPYLVA